MWALIGARHESGVPLEIFEFAPDDAGEFDHLIAALRETEKWNCVEREIDVRLVQNESPLISCLSGSLAG